MSRFAKAPWVVHFNCNSCNGCDIEFLACLTPLYDLERFGILHVGNPKHADILVVTGSVNHRNARVLRNVYEQMPEPRIVVAMGVCAATGGVFAGGYNVLGGIDEVIPVDVFVPGCPARPEAMMDGLLQAAALLDTRAGTETGSAPKPRVTLVPAPAAEPAPVAGETG
jgi:NADH-quinone oxidoreductase subunit B